ncbi:hypothetical protein QBC42DRAFT_212215 [Cladorrhinum samala]|uniref:Uncharacterized protein n=1 Tax=Cladorrhinum samala TaxID=585594 RepID=A0AAV9HCB0_9PEZI|nr:hypothetical protein QBC42DRAFT_212215 [Cladorrhinum samala]
MSTPFIPPQGLYFRLQGVLSGKVLACQKSEDKVSHQDESNGNEDPWFTLVPGTGGNAGYYLIKNWKTGTTLFSRDHREPRVGHTGLEGRWPDNWFKLDFAPGKPGKPDKFRLVSGVGYAIVSKKDDTVGWVTNHPEGEVFEDQYFSFLWEKLEAVDTVWHRDRAVRKDMQMYLAAEQVLENDTDLEQSTTMTLTTTETSTHEVVNTSGFQGSAKFTAGLPLVGSTEITVGGSYEHKVGNTTSTSEAYGSTAPIKAGPHTSVTGQLFLNKGKLEIPVTVTYRNKEGVEATMEGLYKGVTFYNPQTKIFRTPIGNRSADGDPGELIAEFDGPEGDEIVVGGEIPEEEPAQEEPIEEEYVEEKADMEYAAGENEVAEEGLVDEEPVEDGVAEEEVAEEEAVYEEQVEEEVTEEEVAEEEVAEEEVAEEEVAEEEYQEEAVDEEQVEEEAAEEEHQEETVDESGEQAFTDEERWNRY